MTKDLHIELAGLSMPIQKAIIIQAMGQYLSYIEDDGDWIEAWKQWQDKDGLDCGIVVWEPFQDYDDEDLFEYVDSAIYSLARFTRDIITLNERT